MSREPNLRPERLNKEFETKNISHGSPQLQPVSMKHEFQTINRPPSLEIQNEEEDKSDQME